MSKEPIEIQPWEPLHSLTPLRDAMNRLLEESFVGPVRFDTMFGRAFPLDVFESEREYVIEASLPGIQPEALDITATDTGITIHAVVKHEDHEPSGGAYVRRERYSGEVSRTVTFSSRIDTNTVSATYERGILKLVAPKAEATKQTQVKIHVR